MAPVTQTASDDIENIEKQKSTLLRGKQTILGNKIPSRRPALGDRTNQVVPKQNTTKPLLKKPVTNVLQPTKPKVVQKTTVNTFKQPAPKEIKKETKEDLKHKHVIQNKPVTKNIAPYSVQHFGLIEENDLDPLLVPIYINDIIVYLRNLELEYVVNNKFLTGHRTTSRMRCVLINWLVEAHLNFKLVNETLFLCVSIVDRYLEKNRAVGRETLQLVGSAALFIAAKYEEIYAPEIDDIVYICDDLFDKKKIMRMEQTIIKTLDFKFGSPCALHFLRRYSKVGNVEPKNHVLAKYLIELSLIEYEYSYIQPSLVAAAAICLSIQLLAQNCHELKSIDFIKHVSSYSQKDMAPVMKSLAQSVLKSETSKYKAVRNKYSANNYFKISSRTELKTGLIIKLADL